MDYKNLTAEEKAKKREEMSNAAMEVRSKCETQYKRDTANDKSKHTVEHKLNPEFIK